MYNVRVERSAGYAGIAFIIVVIIAAVLPGAPPTPDAPASDVAAFLDAHHSVWLLSGWLSLPATAFFLWFIVQLRAYLRLVPQLDDGLPTYLLTGGVASGALVLVLSLVQIVMGFRPSSELGLPIIHVLYDVFNAGGALIFLPTSIMTFAASQSGRRHNSLPGGLVIVGYIATIGAVISTLSVFVASGFFVMGGFGTFIFGLLPFAVWTIWTSIVLIRNPHGGLAAT
jgi:hypothetical protein